ncbi:DUF982 domain-containing protein [Mesorhizobium sp. CAU 1732]|uniref:DUF982 domain-containing protein n=1 Tax=Mesorhizobium sp. CAU 1732 TaxID=3140358 RepID=UPI003260AD4B
MTMKLSMPVVVNNGFAGPREMRSLGEIASFLDTWPAERRGPIFSTAQRSCRAAMEGHLSVEKARQCFVQFARLTNILVPAVEPIAFPKSPSAGSRLAQ